MSDYSYSESSDSSGSSCSSSSRSLSEEDSETITDIENEYLGKVVNNKYLIIKYIARGTFSRVFLVYNLIHDKFYALKMLFEEYREEGLQETKIYRHFSNRPDSKVVEYIDTFEYQNNICLLTEFMGIDLLDALNIYNDINEIPRTLIIKCIIDTLTGLNELHTCNIVHADLKLENIMLTHWTRETEKYIEWFKSINIQGYREKFYENLKVDFNKLQEGNGVNRKKIKNALQNKFNNFISGVFKKHIDNKKIEMAEKEMELQKSRDLNEKMIDIKNTNAKIIDLGNSELLEDKYGKGYIHIRNYRAPENFKLKIFNQKSDIWTLGCLILEMLSGTHFYDLEGENLAEDLKFIEKSIYDFDTTFSNHLESVVFKNNEEYSLFYTLVKNMLNLDFNKRWSALECKEFICNRFRQEKT